MLTGTADPHALADRLGAPTIAAWADDELVVGGVTALEAIVELRRPGREALLPPGLHPTDPPTLHVTAASVASSPWGPFSWCHVRVSCRSGVRARGFATGAVVDAPDACEALAARWGWPAQQGQVRVRAGFDRTEVEVALGGRTVLRAAGLGAVPLAPDAVQVTTTMNLARTPNGLRLVQVEARPRRSRVDRVRATITAFDGAAWGDERLDPYHVASAVVVRDDEVALPPVRFACRPDAGAFEGTERVGAAGPG